jgi:predicted DNA-binding transcriptional regulator YafY
VNFSPSEANALVTGGILVEQVADASLRAEIQSALLKVRSVLPREDQERVARLARNVATAANIERAPGEANLSLIQQALASRRPLRFQYQGAGKAEPSAREAEPVALLHYLGRWHLIAWCRLRGDYRDFRTDRMRTVEALSETFDAHGSFSLREFLREAMPVPRLKARIRFRPLAADRAKREWWLGILEEQAGEKGSVLTLATVDWDRLAGWLLSFGTDATVLAPKALRYLLVQAANEAARHHAGGD